jgi:LacI family transcriptional regulator, galactose operon repressor
MTDAPAPSRRATLRDVAALAKVDASLVSRVINGDPKAGAAPQTRQRIIDAVRQLDYRPNVVARGLRMARTWTIGVLVPSVTNPMYADVIAGAEGRAHELGYGVVFRTHVEGEREEIFTRLLQQGRVDGLIVASGLLRDAFLRRIASGEHGPVVVVNRRVNGVKASVVVDDAAGAALATRHLLDKGHVHVVGLFGPPAIDTSRRRRKGYSRALREVGLETVAVDMPGWGFRHGYDGIHRILDTYPDTTAVFVSTMVMAVGAIRAVRERGLSVPEDVSLVALHDSELASYLNPPLTTVSLPVLQMGIEAIDLLASLIDGGSPRSVVVAGEPVLIERLSVRGLEVGRESNV